MPGSFPATVGSSCARPVHSPDRAPSCPPHRRVGWARRCSRSVKPPSRPSTGAVGGAQYREAHPVRGWEGPREVAEVPGAPDQRAIRVLAKRGASAGYLPAARRWKRVRFSIFLCFFLRMRLRRFLIREPMRRPKVVRTALWTRESASSARFRRTNGAPGTVVVPIGGRPTGRTTVFGSVNRGSSPLPRAAYPVNTQCPVHVRRRGPSVPGGRSPRRSSRRTRAPPGCRCTARSSTVRSRRPRSPPPSAAPSGVDRSFSEPVAGDAPGEEAARSQPAVRRRHGQERLDVAEVEAGREHVVLGPALAEPAPVEHAPVPFFERDRVAAPDSMWHRRPAAGRRRSRGSGRRPGARGPSPMTTAQWKSTTSKSDHPFEGDPGLGAAGREQAGESDRLRPTGAAQAPSRASADPMSWRRPRPAYGLHEAPAPFPPGRTTPGRTSGGTARRPGPGRRGSGTRDGRTPRWRCPHRPRSVAPTVSGVLPGSAIAAA